MSTAIARMQGAVKSVQSDMGWDDDTWHRFLHKVTGKQSSRLLTFDECKSVFSAAKSQGWVSKQEKVQKLAKSCQYLWLRLKEDGVLHHGSIDDFHKYCRQFTKKTNIFKASGKEASNCLESLKSWCERENIDTGSIGK